jgi:hypothetical protein
MAARIPITATAIISSMSVKPALRRVLPVGPWGLDRVLACITRRGSIEYLHLVASMDQLTPM